MSRNGTGTYSLPAGNPVVTGTVISTTWANGTLTDIATALTQSIASTGVTTPSANLPMGTFRHTGVGNATAKTCYPSVIDVQNGSLITLGAVSGSDTITATAPFTLSAYATGQGFQFVSAGANTGAVTINIDTLGAKSITKNGSVALGAGDISSGQVVEIVYDGTRFQMVGARSNSGTGTLTVNARSSNTIFGTGDSGSMNQFTNTFTQTFPPAATLTAGWYVSVQNIGTGVITFDADGSEVFNTSSGGRTTINLYPGEGYQIVCNGTSFDLVGRPDKVRLQKATASNVASVDLETGFTDDEFQSIECVYSNVTQAAGNLNLRLRKSGSYQTGSTYGYALFPSSGSAAITSNSATSIRLSYASNGGAVTQGQLSIPLPTLAGSQWIWNENGSPALAFSADAYACSGGGSESTNAALTGIQFLSSSGNVVTGNFCTWGNRG